MGLFDFLGTIGKPLFKRKGAEADDIKEDLEKELGRNLQNLQVQFNDGVVTLAGQASSQAAKEKAVLLAGNVQGVRQVNDDRLTVVGQPAAAPTGAGQAAGAAAGQVGAKQTPAAPKAAEPRFYTIESGDTLSKIAKEQYGDANAWHKLFEANREVIQDPDKIYPGQKIRIPQDLSA